MAKLVCDDCGELFDEEEAVSRFSEHGPVKVLTCPNCGSENLLDAEGSCEDCAWACWNARREIVYCGNHNSEWNGEEVSSTTSCGEWVMD